MDPEIDKLQGTWAIAALEVEGVKVAAGTVQGSQIIMRGDRFTTVAMGAEYGGTFAVDPSATPMRLDLTFTEGPHAGETSPAIFELHGDTLLLCLGMAGRDRPTHFATSPGSGHALETLARQPDAAKAEETELHPAGAFGGRAPTNDVGEGDTAKEMDSETGGDGVSDGMAELQGEWTMVSGEMGGTPIPAEFAATGRRVVRGSEVTVSFGGRVMLRARMRLCTADSPSQMDYTLLAGPQKGQVQRGIYEVEGDRVRVCHDSPGSPRPGEFFTTPGDGRKVTVWQRVRP